MNWTLLIFSFLVFSTILNGQSRFDKLTQVEKVYLSKSDSFISNRISKVRFEKYFKFHYLFSYKTNKDFTTFGHSKEQNSMVKITYEMAIPELFMEAEPVVIYDMLNDKCYLADSFDIPDFLRYNTELDLLDTSEIRIALVRNGLPENKLELGRCYYNDSFHRYVWAINEVIVSFDKYTLRKTINHYTVDGLTGQILKVDSNLLIDRTPRSHWDWHSLYPVNQRFPPGTSLDSILFIREISAIQIISKGKTTPLNSKQLRYFKKALRKSKSLGGFYIYPSEFNVMFLYTDKDIRVSQRINLTDGKIHFDLGVDKWGNTFLASFSLPENFKIENLIR
jgi:hypothetical protein